MSRFSERPRVRTAVYLGQNRLTEAGVVLTTSAAVTLIAFWIYLIVQARPVHPYTGIVFFLILPGVFVLGLVLIPIGIWQRFRKLRAKGELPAEYPKVDLRSPFLRRAVVLVGALTFANFAIMGAASYKGVEYMDSAQFCGQTCHTVMEPEYAAYVDSPHSRVSCVECHIGPGAPWFVKAKISGVRQVFAVALQDLLAGRSPRPCTTCGPPATPASTATGRRSSRATSSSSGRSTPTTRRTRPRRPCCC